MGISVRETAMNALARREHSRRELERKLAQKEFDADEIRAALDGLVEDGLLSDMRFTEAFVHARKQRGSGPLKIEMELKQRGVADSLIGEFLNPRDGEWFAQAREVRGKRFGETLPEDYAQRMRQARFLQQRGFTHEQINAVFKKE